MSSVLNARKVKNDLLAKIKDEPWFAGIGTSRDDGLGFVVRVSAKRGIARPDGAVPKLVEGVTVLLTETDAE